jgi:hypothetical protein
MVERLIPNSELCALCRSGRAKAAVAGYRGLHPPVNDRRCGAIDAGESAVTLPFSRHPQSAWRRLSVSLVAIFEINANNYQSHRKILQKNFSGAFPICYWSAIIQRLLDSALYAKIGTD